MAELATGGMATVFLARLSGAGGFQRFVAIKRLHPHLAREPEFTEMFLDEARLAARIHHPNVVPILEIGTSEQGYYLVMEYVEGDTLGRLLTRAAQTGERVPLGVALRIILDVLAGLDASHELGDDEGHPLGVVHRDVSPQNVLVGIDGSARLTDFGVARAASKLSTTRTGHLKGKIAYMAPEQARGAKDIDRRADVFAAGIVCWEVVAGRRLFKGEGEADTLNKVLHEPIPALSAAVPTVPATIEALVVQALDRDRGLRFATAAAFGEALEREARVLGALATHKDVAAHLEHALGAELAKQREALRTWLVRGDAVRRSMAPPGSDAAAGSGGRMRSERPAIRSDRWSASSVNSAVISTRGLETLAPSVPPPAGTRTRRFGLWPWVVLAAVAVIAGAVGWIRARGTAPTVAAPPAPVPIESIVSPKTSETGPAVVAPPPTASTASQSSLPARGRKAPPASDGASAVQRTPTAPSAAVPDDMVRNPYR